MGNKTNQPKISTTLKDDNCIFFINSAPYTTKNHFDFMYVIGRGGFGKVYTFANNRFGRFISRNIKNHTL